MKMCLLKAEIPTEDECDTPEGRSFILTVMMLKGVIEASNQALKEKMTEAHILYALIDDFAADTVKELLDGNKHLEKWIKIHEIE